MYDLWNGITQYMNLFLAINFMKSKHVKFSVQIEMGCKCKYAPDFKD